MKNYLLLLICLFLFQSSVFGQENEPQLKVNVSLKFNENDIVLAKKYTSKNRDILSFENIKLYLSNFEIRYSDKSSVIEKNRYHLIDIENPESLIILLKSKENKEIKSIHYNIGVDSTASVSGAMEGDLDATKGMYWAWQSGFINFKIEGKSKSCKTRKNEFHFHVGGYLEPNYALRKVENPLKQSQIQNNSLTIQIDLAKLFDEINLSKTNSIMIPGKEAMNIADLITKAFTIP